MKTQMFKVWPPHYTGRDLFDKFREGGIFPSDFHFEELGTERQNYFDRCAAILGNALPDPPPPKPPEHVQLNDQTLRRIAELVVDRIADIWRGIEE